MMTITTTYGTPTMEMLLQNYKLINCVCFMFSCITCIYSMFSFVTHTFALFTCNKCTFILFTCIIMSPCLHVLHVEVVTKC